MSKVIVFGPTGAVGSSTAATAAKLGAHVVLAMRDPSKSLPAELSQLEQAQASQFSRVQADLSDPPSVAAAVKQTGATRAFIYIAFGVQDHMRATAQALKDAGVTFVVLLSSFSVMGDLAAIPPADSIPYVHAQAELVLRDVFPDSFVPLRPGSFAGNTLQYKEEIKTGAVSVFGGDSFTDNIVQEDIGRVGGTVLVKGNPDGNNPIYLYGPRVQSMRQTVTDIGKVLGKDVQIHEATEDGWRHQIIEVRKVPAYLAEYMIRQTKKKIEGKANVFGIPIDENDLGNVHKYSGQEPTTFVQWVEKNKHLFE